MAQPALPDISTLHTLPTANFAAILDTLFEPSAILRVIALPLARQEWASYDALIDGVGELLLEMARDGGMVDTERVGWILASHPRLGAKKVDSALSRAEQAAMERASGSEEEERKAEAEELARLNAEYEKAFPGLRYVTWVNGRSRPVIFEDMRRRIERGDPEAERVEGVTAMCDIAKDRVRKIRLLTAQLV
ncbi:hypothetical protein EJ06DRAFT_533548 [Trichodelitschia bisporula]|uniref:Oxo-4-hydroxy-4-carboxy-5-ureidoimidazoline decarboxylase domain-containing protein n=1 Tax=Trichodelitschia bisporula TaxID=703511 RepID=A0A6G1HL76_9PEZI|nr:hypothetical protein EJ06DRAFT_533548 [Trichodelitschia bisporula]